MNLSGASGPAIGFLFAQNSWVKGVAIANGSPSNGGLIQVQSGHHIAVENRYIFGGVIGSTGVYGVELDDCSDCLVLNNIIQGVSTPLMHNGPASGSVWAYNTMRRTASILPACSTTFPRWAITAPASRRFCVRAMLRTVIRRTRFTGRRTSSRISDTTLQGLSRPAPTLVPTRGLRRLHAEHGS